MPQVDNWSNMERFWQHAIHRCDQLPSSSERASLRTAILDTGPLQWHTVPSLQRLCMHSQ